MSSVALFSLLKPVLDFMVLVSLIFYPGCLTLSPSSHSLSFQSHFWGKKIKSQKPHTSENPMIFSGRQPVSLFRKSHNHKQNIITRNNLVSVKMGLKHPHTASTPTRKQHCPQHRNIIRDSDFSPEDLKSLSDF